MANYRQRVSALLFSALPAVAVAQPVAWNQPAVFNGPSARYNHAMANDSARGVTVLFGGLSGLANNAETWEWDGTAWAQRIGGGPSARQSHAMAYDSARAVSVLFGGFGSTNNAETWEWNGAAWVQRVVSGPSARRAHAMAYDSARGVTVLFGGVLDSNGTTNSAETWEWNGTAWTQRVGSGPSARRGHAMAFDSARGVTVLFGGFDSVTNNAETWEWNGVAWTQRVVDGPTPRRYHTMAYDATRGVTVLFGGNAAFGTAANAETWEWNGATWTQQAVSGPTARYNHAMAFDSVRNTAVVFGGYSGSVADNQTWTMCSAAFAVQPAAQAACPSGIANFAVTAAGPGPSTYTWQWQPAGDATPWVDLTEGDNAEVGGTPIVNAADVGSAVLGVRPLAGYVGFAPRSFRCIVTNSCTNVESEPAPLVVCPADLTCDGGIDINDLLFFLSAFESGSSAADLDNGTNTGSPDGGIDINDLLFFLGRFEAGC